MITVKDAGELAVVERIKRFLLDHADILVGAGDDCAVVQSMGNEENLVLTSDPVIEGVHFTTDTKPVDIGHKAVARVLSDLAAMGADPRWILINLVVQPAMAVDIIDEIYRGANRIASRFGSVIIGGDVTEGIKLELHVFGMGTVLNGKAVQRKGAESGDYLFVTGELGGSITGKHLTFEPRVVEGVWLRNWATSMMDVSDGLASDLRRLLKINGVGCDLWRNDIPISDVVQDDVISSLDHALYDGEDFELLFTVSSKKKNEFLQAWHGKFDLECTCIGAITEESEVIHLVDTDGKKMILSGHGFEHFSYNKYLKSERQNINNNSLPFIAITMGDPAGIGPELCLRLLLENSILKECNPIVFGDKTVMDHVSKKVNIPFCSEIISLEDWIKGIRPSGCGCLVDCGCINGVSVEVGKINADCGSASFSYINNAIDSALSGQVCAVVTAPINKESFKLAGIDYPGHTEIFSERASSGNTCMMLTSDKITVTLVTTHIGYNDVAKVITSKRIMDVIELTDIAMRKIRGKKPRISVCALNPHAGENGLFGANEEEGIITPAIELAKEAGINIYGPLPPDTAFVPELLQKTDAVVCMYHDQGLIPFKMMAFDNGVNVTLGLSIVRTSVDHGTAFDIAWRGIADPKSLYEAVLLACSLAEGEGEALEK